MFLPTFLVLLCLDISTSLIRRKKKRERRKGKKKGFTGRIRNDKTSEAIQSGQQGMLLPDNMRDEAVSICHGYLLLLH